MTEARLFNAAFALISDDIRVKHSYSCSSWSIFQGDQLSFQNALMRRQTSQHRIVCDTSKSLNNNRTGLITKPLNRAESF